VSNYATDIQAALTVIGVCVTFRARGSWEGEHACAQLLDACATIHRSLEGFQSVDLPLGLAIAPCLCDCVLHGVNVSMKNPRKSFYCGIMAQTHQALG
jgi:hypothetical protein